MNDDRRGMILYNKRREDLRSYQSKNGVRVTATRLDIITRFGSRRMQIHDREKDVKLKSNGLDIQRIFFKQRLREIDVGAVIVIERIQRDTLQMDES